MGSRVVVTGGAGFIGVSVVDALVELGNEVLVLDSGAAAGFDNLSGSPARLIEGDIRDRDAVAAALDGAVAVVHLAAHTIPAESMAEPRLNFETNVVGTLNVLEAARARHVSRVVFASSNAAVAGHEPPAHEGLTQKPVSPYGASKAAAEAYLRAYTHGYGLAGVSLRFANAYGPRSAHKPSVISAFIGSYLDGGPLRINGSGDQTRDFVYVDDVRDAVLACLGAPAATIAGQVLQVGTGRETSLNELAELLFEVGGGRVAVEHAAPIPADVPRNVSDVTRLREILGVRPRTELREGLRRTLEWFRDQRAG